MKTLLFPYDNDTEIFRYYSNIYSEHIFRTFVYIDYNIRTFVCQYIFEQIFGIYVWNKFSKIMNICLHFEKRYVIIPLDIQ